MPPLISITIHSNIKLHLIFKLDGTYLFTIFLKSDLQPLLKFAVGIKGKTSPEPILKHYFTS
ncbi:MAG: hypothetical protein ABIK39_06185, partial [candidate division WOR-3 bacterium]